MNLKTHELPIRYKLIAVPLRFLFRIFYTHFAWTYDFVAAVVSFGKWNEWVFSVLPYLKGPRILELGHGPGHLLMALRKKGYAALGLDASFQMARIARKRITKTGSGVVTVYGYAQNTPFSPCSFEQIVATFPSEYIISPKTLSEIWRVLVPQGTLIIVPLAWVSNPKWYQRTVNCTFRLTGLRSNWPSLYCDPLNQQGFEVRVETISISSGTVVVIFAQKPART